MLDPTTKYTIAKYIEAQYGDPLAMRHLNIFLWGFDVGFADAIQTARNYVHNWHTHMDSVHEASTKGLLSEVENGILDLQYGDK